MSTTTHQGAVGAETMTAGQVAHDAAYGLSPDSRLWRAQTENVRDFWRRAAAAVVALSAPAPRTDGGMTAGEVAHLLTRMRAASGSEDEGGDCSCNVAGGSDAWQLHDPFCAYRVICEAVNVIEATPAQPAGAVPDGLRALSEAVWKIRVELAALIPDPDKAKVEDWPVANPADAECLQRALVLTGDLLTDLATHPAGQSAGPALCSYVECAALGKSSCEDCRNLPRAAGQSAGSGADLGAYLARQMAWSQRAFGDRSSAIGLTKHIEKECAEIRANPRDLVEWVDVVMLALDGYWRHGGTPADIMPTLLGKLAKNEAREWPVNENPDEPNEHDRSDEPAPDSTRTGQGEELCHASWRVKRAVGEIGTAPSEAQLDELSDAADALHLLLAARPAAPEAQ